jgi:hypothetical protein
MRVRIDTPLELTGFGRAVRYRKTFLPPFIAIKAPRPQPGPAPAKALFRALLSQ